MENTTNTLYQRRLNGRTAQQALAMLAAAAPGQTAVALCWTPRRCEMAMLTLAAPASGDAADTAVAGPLHLQTGVVDAATVYQLRAFTTTHELRWQKDPSGDNHFGVLSAEVPFTDAISVQCAGEAIVGTYLLWGESHGADAKGWRELRSARMGRQHVPVAGAGAGEGRVLLHMREYLKEFDDGNVAVFAERWVKLEAVNA